MGLLLLLFTLTPLYRLLDRPDTGSFGTGAVIRGDAALSSAWWGILLALCFGVLLTLLLPTARIRSALEEAGLWMGRASSSTFALLAALAAGVLALGSGLLLFRGMPTLVDGMAGLLQARAIADGALAVQLPPPEAAWLIPNTVLTAEGWVSQYPPTYLLLLALGHLARAPWLVGPLLVAVTALASVLAAERLLSDTPRPVVRLGGALVALSPFLAFLGGGYLSHLPAAAFSALLLYGLLRAREGGAGWALLAGGASGALTTTRPWLGIVMTLGLTAVLWIPEGGRRHGWFWLLRRMGVASLAGLPFAVGLALYNGHFFGGPLRLGYSVAYGPAHNLGFHPDPWGNQYGLVQALGYTAFDLLTLGVYLLETLLPAVAVVGVWMLARSRWPRGAGTLLVWALLPVAANFFYWHHGFHLGPRMLYEAAPAWCLLTALAVAGLAGRGPEGDTGGPSGDPGSPPAPIRARLNLRDVLLWAFLVSVASTAYLVPLRARSYRWSEETLARIRAPEPPDSTPALVFVHGSWAERISARLQAVGMRLDSIESSLSRNDICLLEEYVTAREAQARGSVMAVPPPLPEIDTRLLPGLPGHLRFVEITEGERVRRDPSRPLSPACRAQAEADRTGIISLAPLLWQGDLPGIESGRPMFVRDLGPSENAGVIARFPERTPYLMATPSPGWPPRIEDYAEGMDRLWGRPAAAQRPAGEGAPPDGAREAGGGAEAVASRRGAREGREGKETVLALTKVQRSTPGGRS